MLTAILIVVACLVGFGVGYVYFSPQMGASTKEYTSSNYVSGRFRNLVATPMSTGKEPMIKGIYKFFFQKDKDVFPKNKLPTIPVGETTGDVSINWLGHSSVLIRTPKLTIIADPILHAKRLPPLNMGPKAFPGVKYTLNDLPRIDVVLISHDHYDHLDMETVKQLKHARFFVPLGVKAHLIRWGIPKKNIVELDWFEKTKIPGARFTFAPARHFSGRGFTQSPTLWGSWIINVQKKTLYFGGDSGYFEEFKKIGKEYGPFDLVMLDTGQYNESWKSVHMLPEESVQAAIDLKAKALLPIHNSKYILSVHAWYEPLNRVTAAGKKRKMKVATPQIGETFSVSKLPTKKWWR